MRPAEVLPAEAGPTLAPAVVAADAGTIMAVIARAASDPSTDVDKLDRLLGMYERITGHQAQQAFDTAMSAAQSEMRRIAADSNNSQTKSRYASFAAMDRALRPLYTKHGFGLSYDTGEGAPEGCVRVVCRVSHNGGDRREYHVDMPADGKGAKGGDVMTKTHATGAALTYGQRYLLKLIFNIAVGEDDDGNGAGPDAARITDEQADEIQALIESVGADRARFLRFMQVERIADIPARNYRAAINALSAKGARQ
jgi:hypothetical protein